MLVHPKNVSLGSHVRNGLGQVKWLNILGGIVYIEVIENNWFTKLNLL